jgi:hypothetical protein
MAVGGVLPFLINEAAKPSRGGPRLSYGATGS